LNKIVDELIQIPLPEPKSEVPKTTDSPGQ
jgi:hypothetical protein